MKISRRTVVASAGAGLMAGCSTKHEGSTRKAAVAIIKAKHYNDDLVSRIREGVAMCGLNVTGKRVLLKPNMVEFDHNTCINTDVAVIAAAYDVFRSMGAADVRIGEGPGHRRDTYAIAELTRYRTEIDRFDDLFVDLNRDDVVRVHHFADRKEMYFPATAMAADLIVSLPKLKTHHWAGATLSMKNLFGLVPGSIYGWPKNELHYIGIPDSIVELTRVFNRHFAIVDGIVGMEGNGPIQGTPKQAGVLVMGSDLPAVDATCCRIMGIDPAKLTYLELAADRLGVTAEARIEQRAEPIGAVRTNFQLIKRFSGFRLA